MAENILPQGARMPQEAIINESGAPPMPTDEFNRTLKPQFEAARKASMTTEQPSAPLETQKGAKQGDSALIGFMSKVSNFWNTISSTSGDIDEVTKQNINKEISALKKEGQKLMPTKNKAEGGSFSVKVFENLKKHEGKSGDTLTNIATGQYGMTKNLRTALRKETNNPELTDKEASLYYIKKSNAAFSKFEGYQKLPEQVKVGLVDSAYNLGYENMVKYRGLSKALKEGNAIEAMKSLLDTANAEGKSVKGIAERRAINYNLADPKNPITRVEQLNDGIVYWKGDTKFYSYNLPKHSNSAVGSVLIS